jgi:hypothetical protein
VRRSLLVPGLLIALLSLAAGYALGTWRTIDSARSDEPTSVRVIDGRAIANRTTKPIEDSVLAVPLRVGIDPPAPEPEPPSRPVRPAQPRDATDGSGAGVEFGSPTELADDPFYNPDGKALTRAEHERLADLVRRFNQDIEHYRQTTMQQAIDDHVDDLIEAGLYGEARAGEPIRPSRRGNALALRAGKWVEYDPATVPEIAAARAEIDARRERYRAEVLAFFGALP